MKRWREVRGALLPSGAAEHLELLRDLYDLSQENRDFFHARYLPGGASLASYKKAIDDAMYPDVYRNKRVSVLAGKQAIARYRQATGDEAGAVDLMTYFVERGTAFTVEFGDIDDAFYSSLESMLERVLRILKGSAPGLAVAYKPRLIAIREAGKDIGWGYGDFLRDAVAEAFPEEE